MPDLTVELVSGLLHILKHRHRNTFLTVQLFIDRVTVVVPSSHDKDDVLVVLVCYREALVLIALTLSVERGM